MLLFPLWTRRGIGVVQNIFVEMLRVHSLLESRDMTKDELI